MVNVPWFPPILPSRGKSPLSLDSYLSWMSRVSHYCFSVTSTLCTFSPLAFTPSSVVVAVFPPGRESADPAETFFILRGDVVAELGLVDGDAADFHDRLFAAADVVS